MREDSLPDIEITSTGVDLGSVFIPAEWMERGGLAIGASGGSDINRVVLTLFVNDIHIGADAIGPIRML